MAKQQSNTETQTQTLHLIINGRVQGVGFRNYLSYKAGVLGIRGWVRNRRDGSVETVIQGTPEAVAEMLACAHRGPRASNVTAVDSREPAAADCMDHGEYTVKPTA